MPIRRRQSFRVRLRLAVLGSITLVTLTLAWMLKDYGDNVRPHQGLVYCSEASPETFNPQLGNSSTTVDATTHQIYDRLVDVDAEGNVRPGLAYKWQISRDKKSYKFSLRQGVNFHHTDFFRPSRTMTSEDVVFSFSRILDQNHPYHSIGGGQYPYFQGVGLGNLIRSVVAVDPFTVQFDLLRPDASFLTTLATDFAVILSAEYGDWLERRRQKPLIDTKPIGTGPFHFVSYRKDSYIKYRRHPAYWGPPAKLERLVFDITPPPSARLGKLLTGECDVIALPSASEMALLRKNENVRLSIQTGLNVGYLAFNTQHPPLDNVKVRRAIAHAINRDRIMAAVYFGTATLANSVLPPVSWAFNDSLPFVDYDPETSKALLAEAGLAEGFEFELWAPPIQRVYNPSPLKMAQLIKDDLAKVGIKTQIVTYDWQTFRRNLQAGKHDATLLGWMADTADPDNFFRPVLSCQALSHGTNRAQWCDFEFDRLLNDALSSSDRSVRKHYYEDVQEIISKQLPVFPLAHALRFQAHRSNIKGMGLNPYGGIRFSEAERE
ncbi:ABC transporter substrate-binding protein SapA [Corallincola platygyrae]|uniref:ABC transporter substrate-binding protein SapA n=1 Tax=Corallincola platygyrae TaxID=1193278 RepID=A0ABW4XQY3_9GAMM